ncbi:hypothetical protein NPIL_134221 [Nephila pilipes]|uniref:SWIM-type domain-containing protein n=1 Tax=Nephila pilipes TaxID=299642 RepID=A0A8X6Q265_NEPPI|nr:hypothetical protein NPIL_134221 [Nephila pilipes]
MLSKRLLFSIIMSSEYYIEIDTLSKAWYEEKLTYNGNKLPDPFDPKMTKHWFPYSKTMWPQISFGDIYMYLAETENTYTREEMKNYKSLDAYNYVLSGKVSPISGYRNDTLNICILTCKVLSGQSCKKYHHCWISAAPNGIVHNGHCTCMVGLGKACSHVAALLFAVELINKEQNEASSSVTRKRKKTGKKFDPIPVALMNFNRKRKCKKEIFRKSVKPPKEAYETFIAAIKKYVPDAPYLKELSDNEEKCSAFET